jgi:hypothetical protein
MREFYPLRTKARSGRITRQDIPKIEQRLRYLVAAYDRALAVGEPPNLRIETLEALGSWIPSPGKHCGNCAASRLCPIPELYRDDGGIRTPEQAAAWAAVRMKAKSIHKFADKHLQIWANLHGPVPIKHAKGRRVLGYRKLSNGKTRWDEFTPEGVDRPPDQVAYDPNLGDAAHGTGRMGDPVAVHRAALVELEAKFEELRGKGLSTEEVEIEMAWRQLKIDDDEAIGRALADPEDPS